MFDGLKEVKCPKKKTNRFQEFYKVKYFNEIKRLKNLKVKVETYLEHKRASRMELFCEYI